jgi:hypothetical protein
VPKWDKDDFDSIYVVTMCRPKEAAQGIGVGGEMFDMVATNDNKLASR